MQKPIKISRSGLRLFQECPRCFWLDLHHKIKRPPGYPYTLSSAVDYLVKREFDKYRGTDELPPAFAKQGIDAKLFSGPELSDWRSNFKGVSFHDKELDATLYGAVDDVLEFPDGSLAVVDYKSSGSKEITIYDDYQKQMDIYTHILRLNGYKTQPNAYFVFYQVDKTGDGFQNTLPFREELRTVQVDPDWVGGVFKQAVQLARQDEPPRHSDECEHCHYVRLANQFQLNDNEHTS